MSISYENLWIILAQKGMKRVDLCEKACVTRRIFYRHYSNKLGTLQALLDHRVGEFVKETTE